MTSPMTSPMTELAPRTRSETYIWRGELPGFDAPLTFMGLVAPNVHDLVLPVRRAIMLSVRQGIRPIGSADAELTPPSTLGEEPRYWLPRFQIQKPWRHKGLGTKMMGVFTWLLDRHTLHPCELYPNPYDETIDLDRLIDFYEAWGWKSPNPRAAWVRHPDLTRNESTYPDPYGPPISGLMRVGSEHDV